MKTVNSLIVTLVMLSSICFSQKLMTDKIPANINQAFAKEFPKAMEPNWRMDKDTYQVMFMLSGTKHAAKFDKTGQWIDKEERINLSNLPKELTESIAKNFSGYKAYEAEKVETPAKGVLYNVGLEKEQSILVNSCCSRMEPYTGIWSTSSGSSSSRYSI